MKAAIYSRIMEDDQRDDVQLFFNELEKQNIEPVLFESFHEQIREKIKLSSDAKTFLLSDDLNTDIDFIISLG